MKAIEILKQSEPETGIAPHVHSLKKIFKNLKHSEPDSGRAPHRHFLKEID